MVLQQMWLNENSIKGELTTGLFCTHSSSKKPDTTSEKMFFNSILNKQYPIDL